jgi:hypothetical protein
MAYSSRSGNAMTIPLRKSGITVWPITTLSSKRKVWLIHVWAIQIWLTTHNSGFCVDLENGITTTGSKAQVQTWKCSAMNSHQVWTLWIQSIPGAWTSNSFTRPLFRLTLPLNLTIYSSWLLIYSLLCLCVIMIVAVYQYKCVPLRLSASAYSIEKPPWLRNAYSEYKYKVQSAFTHKALY